MTQAFYDVLAIKPTYLGITLFPCNILKPWHASDSFPVKRKQKGEMLMTQYILGQ